MNPRELSKKVKNYLKSAFTSNKVEKKRAILQTKPKRKMCKPVQPIKTNTRSKTPKKRRVPIYSARWVNPFFFNVHGVFVKGLGQPKLITQIKHLGKPNKYQVITAK